MSMPTAIADKSSVIGWGFWKGDQFDGHTVHATKDGLVGGRRRIDEEYHLMHGREACRTEVTIGAKRPGVLYSIAVQGRLVPEALTWSCLSTDPDRTRDSAIRLITSKNRDIGVSPNEMATEALERFSGFETVPGAPRKAKNKRQQGTLDRLHQRVLAAFQRLGVEVVPVAFKRLETVRSIKPFTCPDGWRIKKRFKVELIELLDNYWFGFRDLEVYAAMARTTWKPDGAVSGPFELLSRSSCVNSSSIAAFSGKDWRDDLRRRFQHILLHRTTGAAEEWREKHGIRLGNTYAVNWPTAEQIDPPYWENGRRALGDKEKVDRLLTENGWLAWSLNECWPHAIKIHHVSLQFCTAGASVGLEYGFANDHGSWNVTLAHQKPGEPLIFTIERAQRRLDKLKDPNAKPPLHSYPETPAPPASEARDKNAEWNPPRWIEETRQMAEFRNAVEVHREFDC